MRVLVISNLFPPHALGGYERACADVVGRWRKRGHHIAVLTSDHRIGGVPDGDDAGVRRALPVTSVYRPVPSISRRASVERAARAALDAAIAEEQPDIAVVWNMAGVPLSIIRRLHDHGVPAMFVVADSWLVRAPRSDPWIAPFVGGSARRAVGRIAATVSGIPTNVPRWESVGRWVFCSEALRRQVAIETGTPFGDAAVVPLGVDTEDFPIDGDSPASTWGWKVLFVGRLDASKGIDTLVRAFASLPADADLEVCSPVEPLHVSRVRELARTLGVDARVHIESVERAHLASRYRAADVCVFPSEWEEPFGIVPLEAMACSTPVVASGTGGSGEYLRDGENCLITRPGDASAIASALTRLAGDAGLRQHLVEGGRATAGSFTVDRLADRLEALVPGMCETR